MHLANFLVTGGNGMVGSHVILHLMQNNYNVIALKRSNASVRACKKLFHHYSCAHLFERIQWEEVNLNDPTEIEAFIIRHSISHVVHASGKVSFNALDWQELWLSHVVHTRHLVNASIGKAIRFIHISSLAVFQGTGDLEITENSQKNPDFKLSVYAHCKNQAELEVWRAQAEGLDTVILNPGVIIAPGYEWRGSNSMFAKLKWSTRFYTSGSTGYIGAGDLARIITQIAHESITGERFICIERNLSYQELMECARKTLSRKERSLMVPRVFLILIWMCSSIGSFFLGRKTQFTKSLIHALTDQKIYSNTKLIQKLNIQLEPIPKIIEQILLPFK